MLELSVQNTPASVILSLATLRQGLGLSLGKTVTHYDLLAHSRQGRAKEAFNQLLASPLENKQTFLLASFSLF